MNKAFVREPDDDGRAYCPRCGSLGTAVRSPPMDTHIRPEFRSKLGSTGWFCSYPPCAVAYFDLLGGLVLTEELRAPVYPKEEDVSVCACFPFFVHDIELDVDAATPLRIRDLLARSQSEDARCGTLAADGKCCLTEVKRIYIRLREQRKYS